MPGFVSPGLQFIHIGGPNFIDTSPGIVSDCPRAMDKLFIDLERDCRPE